MAKPYQPTSIDYTPYVMGSSGAVRVDADGSGSFHTAYDYASPIVQACKGDLAATIAGLKDCDQATASQAAGLLFALSPENFVERQTFIGCRGSCGAGWI